jgi:hypothetical protein
MSVWVFEERMAWDGVMFDVLVLGKIYSPLIYTKLHAIGHFRRQYG